MRRAQGCAALLRGFFIVSRSGLLTYAMRRAQGCAALLRGIINLEEIHMNKQPHRAALPAPRRAVTTVKNIPDKAAKDSRFRGNDEDVPAHGSEKEKEGVATDQEVVTRSIPRQTKKSKESKS